MSALVIGSFFPKKTDNNKKLKSIYSKINGFTINYYRWYIDLFACTIYNGLSILDWLTDFEFDSENNLTITGFEDLQAVYHDGMENEKWKGNEL